jgi:chorismate mutase/prephenate dehydratase
MSLKLHDTRKSIDKVDKEIVKLLDERGKLALDIAKAKNNKNFSSGSIVYVPSREREVLKNISSSKSILGKEALKHI